MVAFVLGWNLNQSSDSPPVAAGTIEFDGTLQAPDSGGGSAEVVVEKTGIGRVISIDSDDLPILPTGDYYELWFVGPDDSPESPDRISAGTFHPDADGRSQVNFAAAVDPTLFPAIEVTAEPADGNPEATGPVVLRATIP